MLDCVTRLILGFGGLMEFSHVATIATFPLLVGRFMSVIGLRM
jgi:hypothetical protein